MGTKHKVNILSGHVLPDDLCVCTFPHFCLVACTCHRSAAILDQTHVCFLNSSPLAVAGFRPHSSSMSWGSFMSLDSSPPAVVKDRVYTMVDIREIALRHAQDPVFGGGGSGGR